MSVTEVQLGNDTEHTAKPGHPVSSDLLSPSETPSPATSLQKL